MIQNCNYARVLLSVYSNTYIGGAHIQVCKLQAEPKLGGFYVLSLIITRWAKKESTLLFYCTMF